MTDAIVTLPLKFSTYAPTSICKNKNKNNEFFFQNKLVKFNKLTLIPTWRFIDHVHHIIHVTLFESIIVDNNKQIIKVNNNFFQKKKKKFTNKF